MSRTEEKPLIRHFPQNVRNLLKRGWTGDPHSRESQSPTRNNSSHCRKSPLNPKLSATWKVAMTRRSIRLPDFPWHQLAMMEIKTVIALLCSRSKFQTVLSPIN
jgi:hypothetical protein